MDACMAQNRRLLSGEETGLTFKIKAVLRLLQLKNTFKIVKKLKKDYMIQNIYRLDLFL